jgi:hypothetical protein
MLRMCSLGARGLWIEMIALMHQANPYGHLLVSGLSPTDTQLAALVGCPSDQITPLVGELEAAGVFSRTRSGVIYSRKMTRMQKKAATARNNGRKGGNPSLGKSTDILPLDNPEDNPKDKPQNQKLEPEEGKKEEAKASSQKNRGSRLRKDWVLPKAWGEWAIGEGWSESHIRAEADKFRDYWVGKAGRDGTKMDWEATFRNWMRNSKSANSQQKEKSNGWNDTWRGIISDARMADGSDCNTVVPLLPARR